VRDLGVLECALWALLYRGAGSRDRVPSAAESGQALAGGPARPLVAGAVVERVAVVGELNPAVPATGRAQERTPGTGDRPWLAVRGERRPGARALAIARARALLVVRPQVERPAVRVDDDPTKAARPSLTSAPLWFTATAGAVKTAAATARTATVRTRVKRTRSIVFAATAGREGRAVRDAWSSMSLFMVSFAWRGAVVC